MTCSPMWYHRRREHAKQNPAKNGGQTEQPLHYTNVLTTKDKANLPRRNFPFNFFTFCTTLIMVAVCTSTTAHSNQFVLRSLYAQTVKTHHMMFFLIVTTPRPPPALMSQSMMKEPAQHTKLPHILLGAMFA